MTDVDQYKPDQVAVSGPVGESEWQQLERQANLLASTSLVPNAFRNKPNEIIVAAMMGRDLGWSPTTALRCINVIEGKPTLTAEAMAALVRQRGHSISGEGDSAKAVVTGTRADTGDTITVTWTVDDAVIAGLCKMKDGRTYARSSKGKILPWEAYPAAMLWARAISQLCRWLFPDVVNGMGYTSEELGDIEVDGPSPEYVAFRVLCDRLKRSCADPGAMKTELLASAEFDAGGIGIGDIGHRPELIEFASRFFMEAITACESDDTVVDAEVVESAAVTTPDGAVFIEADGGAQEPPLNQTDFPDQEPF